MTSTKLPNIGDRVLIDGPGNRKLEGYVTFFGGAFLPPDGFYVQPDRSRLGWSGIALCGEQGDWANGVPVEPGESFEILKERAEQSDDEAYARMRKEMGLWPGESFEILKERAEQSDDEAYARMRKEMGL